MIQNIFFINILQFSVSVNLTKQTWSDTFHPATLYRIFLRGCVKAQFVFVHKLIGAEGAKTPAGAAGQVRPRRSDSDEEKEKRKRLAKGRQAYDPEPLAAAAGQAHRPPRGKRSTKSGNQLSNLTQPFTKKSHG